MDAKEAVVRSNKVANEKKRKEDELRARKRKETENNIKKAIPSRIKELRKNIEYSVEKGYYSADISLSSRIDGVREICRGVSEALEKDGYRVSIIQNDRWYDGYHDDDFVVTVYWGPEKKERIYW
jgi:hypothetical protein